MALFAISDIHLGFYHNKKMDIFGEKWVGHYLKLKTNWEQTVKDDDVVILAGDISWGINMKEALPDLDFINSLSGKKIMHSGNHDYW